MLLTWLLHYKYEQVESGSVRSANAPSQAVKVRSRLGSFQRDDLDEKCNSYCLTCWE